MNQKAVNKILEITNDLFEKHQTKPFSTFEFYDKLREQKADRCIPTFLCDLGIAQRINRKQIAILRSIDIQEAEQIRLYGNKKTSNLNDQRRKREIEAAEALKNLNESYHTDIAIRGSDGPIQIDLFSDKDKVVEKPKDQQISEAIALLKSEGYKIYKEKIQLIEI